MTQPMRLTKRRQLIAKAQGAAEVAIAAKVGTLFRKRYGVLKRELRNAHFNRRNLGKLLKAQGGALAKLSDGDDQTWQEWIDDFETQLMAAFTEAATTIYSAESKFWETRRQRPGALDPQTITDAYNSRAGKQIKNIALDTQRAVLADIAAWHSTDAGIRELIDTLGQYFSDSRATTIARTESTFITSQVSDNLYRQVGVKYFNVDLADEDGLWPCAECRAQADANPHPMDDQKPPYHPRDRCSTVPANEDGSVFV